jgi:ABC-2 type transport system permease protein
MWGQAVLTSVIEEKSNRVVEVIVAAVPPVRLLAGKLLGVGAVGLTQSLVWVLSLALLSALGAGMAVAAGMGGLPEIGLPILAGFVACFLLGFFLYASMFAAVGSSVNTTQEAQSLVFPVFLPLVVSIMVFPMVMQSPDSTASVVLSLIPFFTPILMFLRIAVLTPPAWQIALAFGLTGLTIAGVLFVAGRIYRVGILMYGKRPTFPEIMKWVGRR